jgi:transposase
MHRHTVADIMRRFWYDGRLQASGAKGVLHRDRRLTPQYTQLLLDIVRDDDSLTWKELVVELCERTGGDCLLSRFDIFSALRELDFTYKVREKHNSYADPDAQELFAVRMYHLYTHLQFMWTDESGIDEKGSIERCEVFCFLQCRALAVLPHCYL